MQSTSSVPDGDGVVIDVSTRLTSLSHTGGALVAGSPPGVIEADRQDGEDGVPLTHTSLAAGPALMWPTGLGRRAPLPFTASLPAWLGSIRFGWSIIIGVAAELVMATVALAAGRSLAGSVACAVVAVMALTLTAAEVLTAKDRRHG